MTEYAYVVCVKDKKKFPLTEEYKGLGFIKK